MRFVLVRGSNPSAIPTVRNGYRRKARLRLQTPEKLRQLLDTIGSRRLPVVINSPGGDLLGALAAGRLIRERKLDVAVARTDFMECEPERRAARPRTASISGSPTIRVGECDAACPIMLAGGVRRLVGPHAGLSVQSLGQEQKVKTYLEEMAIGPGLFAAIQLHSSQKRARTQDDAETRTGDGATIGRRADRRHHLQIGTEA